MVSVFGYFIGQYFEASGFISQLEFICNFSLLVERIRDKFDWLVFPNGIQEHITPAGHTKARH